MKCKCGAELITRSGKFGKFLCCPNSTPSNNHGTVSLANKPLTAIADSGEFNRNTTIYMASEFGYNMSSTEIFLDIDVGDGNHWSDHGPSSR